jgi:hypothetical protein
LKKDIEDRIVANYKDPEKVYKLLKDLKIEKERDRIIRCILILSDSDYSSVKAWG